MRKHVRESEQCLLWKRGGPSQIWKSDLVLQVAKMFKPASFITRCQFKPDVATKAKMSWRLVDFVAMILQCPLSHVAM